MRAILSAKLRFRICYLMTCAGSRLQSSALALPAAHRQPGSWSPLPSRCCALSGKKMTRARPRSRRSSPHSSRPSAPAATAPSQQSALDFATRVFDYLDLDAIARTYAEYGVGEQLQIILEAFCIHFFACANDALTWTACLDAFEGVGQVPMMTVHKSKGLEYDTIIFVGLDDRAWWAHTPGDPEGVAAFFVALSRAKQRAIFAFCQQRGNRNNVAELYQLLTDAGVPEIAI